MANDNWNGLLHDGLSYWARREPEKTAVVMDDEDRVAYGDLDRWTDATAACLQGSGIGVGDRVSIVSANCIEWVVAAFAVLKAGGVVVPFNDRFLADELRYVTQVTEPKLIIADTSRMALLEGTLPDVPRLAMESITAFRNAPLNTRFERVRVASSAIAMIIYTSGSTSQPKGAMMSHGNYIAKYMEMRLLDGRLGPATRSLMPFGLHSSPGLPWGILFTSTLGGTLYFTSKYQADRTLRTLRDDRINFFIGAPLIYDQVSLHADFASADLSALTFARVGGATANEETLRRWREKGVAVRQLYGMTEMGGGAIIATEEEAIARPDTCGRGLAFTRVRIVGDDGVECEPGQPGHILLRGPGMMSGYWRDPQATEDAIGDGWMRTGDIGSVDSDGYFCFAERSKEMIKSGGYNVSPSEIEAVLREVEHVLEVAVFAVADDMFGESPCACVYSSAPLSETLVFTYCASKLAGFKLPRYLVLLDQPLPRLANEKVDRRRLKSDYADIARRKTRLSTSAAQ